MTAQLGTLFELPKRPRVSNNIGNTDAGEVDEQMRQLDAVIVNGDIMRLEYGVWKLWMKSPERQFTYRALKQTINREKSKMCTEAIARKKHLVIPKSMSSNIKNSLLEVEELAGHGYTNHVAVVLAPRGWCNQRGHEREVVTGKLHRPEEFDKSVDAIIPMVSACNGYFKVARVNTTSSASGPLEFQVLASGNGGKAKDAGTPSAGYALDTEVLRKAIDSAIEDSVVGEDIGATI